MILDEINNYLNKTTVEYNTDKNSLEKIIDFMFDNMQYIEKDLHLKLQTLLDININLLNNTDYLIKC